MKVAVLQCSCSVGAAVNVEEVGVEEDAVLFFPRFIRDRAANDICRWTAVEPIGFKHTIEILGATRLGIKFGVVVFL